MREGGRCAGEESLALAGLTRTVLQARYRHTVPARPWIFCLYSVKTTLEDYIRQPRDSINGRRTSSTAGELHRQPEDSIRQPGDYIRQLEESINSRGTTPGQVEMAKAVLLLALSVLLLSVVARPVHDAGRVGEETAPRGVPVNPDTALLPRAGYLQITTEAVPALPCPASENARMRRRSALANSPRPGASAHSQKRARISSSPV